MRKYVAFSILSFFLLSLPFSTGTSNAGFVENPVDCYALIMAAANDTNTTIHKKLDPIDVNGAEVSLSRVYGALIKAKFKRNHIVILYCDGKLQPNWAEKKNRKYFKMMKKYHFDKQPLAATKQNIDSVMNQFKQKLDENDQFVFYIITHGAANGTLQLDRRGSWPTSQIQQTFSGLKSKTNYILFDSCYSGKILDDVNIPNAFIFSTTGNRSPGWVDRNFSNCAYFLEMKLKKSNDKDKDGIVDCEEAFDATKKFAEKYDKEWRKYISTKYKPPKPTPPGIMAKASIIPCMEIGETFEINQLGPGTKSSSKKRAARKKRVRKDPGERYMKRAEGYVKSKKYVKAIETYEKVRKMGKRTKLADEAAGKMKKLLENEETAAAYKEAKRIEKLESNLAMAESYFLSSAFDKVIEYCKKVIEAAPDSEQAKKAKKLMKDAENAM